jgi:hypothetical protein
MNRVSKCLAYSALAASLIAGAVHAGPDDRSSPQSRYVQSSPERGRIAQEGSEYAEQLYADFTKYSQGKVGFQVMDLARGPLTELKNIRLADLVGATKVKLVTSHGDAAIENPRFMPVAMKHTETPDASQTGQTLQESGFSMDKGVYRLLSVRTKAGSTSRNYMALEMCWEGQQRCYVYDPVIDFVDWQVNRLRPSSTQAEGGAATGRGLPTKAFVSCKIAGYSNSTIEKSFPSKTVTVSGVADILVGKAYTKISCVSTVNGNCYAVINDRYANTSGYRNKASGATVACDYIYGSNANASTGYFSMWARTGCAAFYRTGATMRYKLSGSGVNTVAIIDVALGTRGENDAGFKGQCVKR